MSEEQDISVQGRKKHYLGLVFGLGLVLCAGGIYLWLQETGPAEKLIALPQPATAPAAQAPQPAMVLPSFDAVSADAAGMLVAAGKGQAGSRILLKTQAETLGETWADKNGEWVLILEKPLAPGRYNLSLLSVDPQTQASAAGGHIFVLTIEPREGRTQISEAGRRGKQPGTETAATATAPQAASAAAQPSNPVKVAGVRQGDTLWAIARHYYGSGARYGEIAEANKGQIKNPDLIYPSQQLAIPH